MGKGEQTRAAVLDHALTRSSTIGLDGLSLGELARDVGMSKSGLFAHFSSKEELQLRVIHRARDRFVLRVVAPALQQPRGEPRVRALIDNWISWDTTELPGGCVFINFAREYDDRPGPLRDALVAGQLDWVDTIETATKIAIEEKHFREDLDVPGFAFEAHGIVLAHVYYKRMLRDEQATARTRKAFDRLVGRARNGR